MTFDRAAQILKSPVPLIFMSAIHTVQQALLAVQGQEESNAVGVSWWLAFSLTVVYWLRTERTVRGISTPFEMDAFNFWAWPYLIFYHSVRTRGWRGVFLGFGINFLYTAPSVISDAIRQLNAP